MTFPSIASLPRLPGNLTERLAAMRLPAFTLPPVVARIVSRLPQHPPALLLISALNLGLDRVIARETLQPLTAKHLRLIVSDAGLTLDFTLTAQGFRLTPAAGEADMTISATMRDFIALALREEDADTLFFSRRLVMEGETDLGLLVKNTLDAIDWSILRGKAGNR